MMQNFVVFTQTIKKQLFDQVWFLKFQTKKQQLSIDLMQFK